MQGIETINSLTTYTAGTGAVKENAPGRVSQGSGETGREFKAEQADKQMLSVESQISKEVQQNAEQDEKQIKQAADTISKYLQKYNIGLKFGVDEESGKQYFQLVDQSQNKVIKQIPSEEIIALSRKLTELQGAILNEVV